MTVFPDLYDIRGEPSIDPDPVARRNHTDASHTAEDYHTYPSPVIAEVTRVDLSAEDGQDQGEHCQQVKLSPKLQERRLINQTRYSKITAEVSVSLLVLYLEKKKNNLIVEILHQIVFPTSSKCSTKVTTPLKAYILSL